MYVVHVIDSETKLEGYLWRGRAVRLENAQWYSCPRDAKRALGAFTSAHKASGSIVNASSLHTRAGLSLR